MNKKEYIGFRLESELLSEIEKQAKKEGRSKSNLIQIALKEYLNKKK